MCLEDVDINEMVAMSEIEGKIKTLPAKVVFEMIKKGEIEVPQKMTRKVVSMFNSQFAEQGWKVGYNQTNGWTLERQGTKYAKFNEKAMSFYARG